MTALREQCLNPIKRDLTNEQWELLSRLIPIGKPGGRPRQVDMQAVVNAILYGGNIAKLSPGAK